MAAVHLTVENLEHRIISLFDKLESMQPSSFLDTRRPMQQEIRTLELWRAVIAECLATFFLVFIVSGTYVPWSGGVPTAGTGPLNIAVATGLAMASLLRSFGQISGGHLNPAVTIAFLVTKKVSPLRASLYVTAQCGGAIAGAAMLYGLTSDSKGTGSLGATVVTPGVSTWQGFGLELILSFVLVFCIFSVSEPRRPISNQCVAIGITYLACTLVALTATGASFNPARSLGPAFVMNKWKDHWIYWMGPLIGGVCGALLYEFIFNPRRQNRRNKDAIDGESSSIHSDDPYDDVDKSSAVRSNMFNTIRSQNYRPAVSNPASPSGAGNYTQTTGISMYTSPAYEMKTSEGIYSGSKSMYTRSPPLPRSNLSRSESMCTRIPASGLSHAESTYLNRNRESANHLQRSKSIYTTNMSRNESAYSPNYNNTTRLEDYYQPVKGNNDMYRRDGADSGYSTVGGGRRQDSSDSSYGANYVPKNSYKGISRPKESPNNITGYSSPNYYHSSTPTY